MTSISNIEYELRSTNVIILEAYSPLLSGCHFMLETSKFLTNRMPAFLVIDQSIVRKSGTGS